MTDRQTLNRKNRRVGLCVALVIACMIGITSQALPLYRAFCQATGYGGTTNRVAAYAGKATDRQVTVHFNADISPDLDWEFRPEQQQVTLAAGQKGFASFEARNNTGSTLSGSAIYNVVPDKVGKYFHKIQCFCFSEQTLEPHQKVSMPVIFYVDPAFATDIDMRDVTDITLSYTFFKSDTQALERAVEGFYNRPAAGDPKGAGQDETKKGVKQTANRASP
jgi:cytochrome c oxidase assembly protein subunit 11